MTHKSTQDKPVKLERFKSWLSDLHIWRFHLQLWSVLNDRPSFSYSYQPPGYWTPVGDPRAIAALRLDEELGLGETLPDNNGSGVDKTPNVQLSNTKETK